MTYITLTYRYTYLSPDRPDLVASEMYETFFEVQVLPGFLFPVGKERQFGHGALTRDSLYSSFHVNILPLLVPSLLECLLLYARNTIRNE